jgi:hypothetical protein
MMDRKTCCNDSYEDGVEDEECETQEENNEMIRKIGTQLLLWSG